MTAIHNYSELVKFLEDSKIPHHKNDQAQLIELPSNASPPLTGNLYIKWERSVPFIQIVQFMVDDVPAERLRDLETAILRLDNQLEVGGFNFDYDRRRLYCRLTVPVFPPDGIQWATLNQLAAGVVRNGKEFIDAFKEVLGGKSGEHIIDIYRTRKGAQA